MFREISFLKLYSYVDEWCHLRAGLHECMCFVISDVLQKRKSGERLCFLDHLAYCAITVHSVAL